MKITTKCSIFVFRKVNPEYIVLNTTNQEKAKEERLVTHAFQVVKSFLRILLSFSKLSFKKEIGMQVVKSKRK